MRSLVLIFKTLTSPRAAGLSNETLNDFGRVKILLATCLRAVGAIIFSQRLKARAKTGTVYGDWYG
jgi:hypothetical protein